MKRLKEAPAQKSAVAEKVEDTKEIQRLTTAPVIDFVIRYDARVDGIGTMVIGGQLTYQDAYALLDRARIAIQDSERKEMLATVAKDGKDA